MFLILLSVMFAFAFMIFMLVLCAGNGYYLCEDGELFRQIDWHIV